MTVLLLVAVSLGLSNFAAAVGIGAAGIRPGTRLRVGLVFGAFEAGMPVAGLLLGHGLAHTLGSLAHLAGGALLIATGLYDLVQGTQGTAARGTAAQGMAALLVTGFALSIDNLAAGFALGTYHVGLAVAAVTIGAVSVALSLLGLELSHRLGSRTGARGDVLAGLVLIAVGVAVGTGAL